LSEEQQQKLLSGVTLDDGVARCQSVEDGGGDEDASNHWYRVVLREGRNREVRRIFEALGVMVSRLIRTRYGVVAMPTAIKRGEWLELEAPAVNALIESAGLPPRSAPDGRGGREQRGGGKDGRRQGPPHAHGQPHARAHGAPGSSQPRPHHKGPKPGFRPHGKGPPHQGHSGPAPNNGQARFSGAPHRQPPRQRGNFDEVQPLSNANASPFATPRNANSGGVHRGFGAHDGPRHRSGPRAKAAGFGGGQKGPGSFGHRHTQRPEKPRAEVNGNVAPPGLPAPSSDDDEN
jgi:23S rRNA pseudouridine2605 synthase